MAMLRMYFCMSLFLFGIVSQVILARPLTVYTMSSRLRSTKLFKAFVNLYMHAVECFGICKNPTVKVFWYTFVLSLELAKSYYSK